VLFFIEHECPCAREAAPFFAKLQAAYRDACNVVGVINADAGTAKTWAKTAGADFPIIADPRCEIIRAYGADYAAYNTLVAAGGTIAKTYPGYGGDMLRELSGTIARTSGIAERPLALGKIADSIVVGCPIEPMEQLASSLAR
jgi:hypothetical protein